MSIFGPKRKPVLGQRRGFLLAGALGVCAALWAWWPRKSAPDAAFIYLNGKRTSLAQLRGKVVLVNFWSTSCAPCLKEMPEWINTWQQFKGRNFELVAIAMHYDAPNYVIDYAQRQALPFPVTIDVTGQLAKAFGDVNVIPSSFLIDKQGNILQTMVGAPQFSHLRESIQRALLA